MLIGIVQTRPKLPSIVSNFSSGRNLTFERVASETQLFSQPKSTGRYSWAQGGWIHRYCHDLDT
jgi:hypothetical protein